jgi:cytochrome P450
LLDAVSKFHPPAPTPRDTSPGLLQLLRVVWDNPVEAWTRAHFEQPIVINRYPFGEFVIVSEASAIRRVLVENVANYRKDTIQKRVLTVLSNGLLTAEDEQWRFQRTAMTPIFARRTVRDFTPAMLQAIDGLIARWRDQGDDVVDVAAETSHLALDVLERTIFSDGLGADTQVLRDGMRAYFDALGRMDPFDLLGLPDFVPRLTRWRAAPTFRLFSTAIENMVATRRERLARDADSMPRDILTQLMQAKDRDTGRMMTEAEIRANILTFMAAGHETTANAITWTLYLLSQSPHWSDLVLTEVEDAFRGPPETLCDRLPVTRAVVEESLRLYPPIISISRVAGAADQLAGVPIRKGTMVLVAPYVLHRHRLLWEHPDEFDPSRFLADERARIERFAYLPFGVGGRGCIGQVFALQETILAVAAITANFAYAVAEGHAVWPLQRITLRPRDGLPMYVRQRRPNLRLIDGRARTPTHGSPATGNRARHVF